MLAISVKQPYAEAIASGVKRAEYRSRPTNHRGDLLIVASKSAATAAGESLPRGVAVCVVRVVDCRERNGGGYAWILEAPRRVEPIALKGSAAFYHVADEQIRVTSAPVVEPEKRAARVTVRAARPYTLEIDGRIVERCITAKDARARAEAIATERRVHVTIERDGYEIASVDGSEPEPEPEPEPGAFTFASRGVRIGGAERSERAARATARALAWVHNAPIAIMRDGREVKP